MAEPKMELVDIHGAYAHKGPRPYTQTAGEIALAQGWALTPEEYDKQYGNGADTSSGSPLPGDFPGRDELATAGYETVESVPKSRRALEAIPGIGKATAGKVLDALGVVE